MVQQKKTPQTNQVNLTDIFYFTLRRWPWIILSVVVCVGLAVLYLMRTPSLYTRSAEILIKSDSQGKSSSTDLSAFADMGLVQMNNNITDEVNKIKSPDIMISVAKRLHLDIGYYVDGRFHREILYGSALPLTVEFTDMHENERAQVEIEVDSDGSAQLVNLCTDERDISLPNQGKFAFGDTIASSLGGIVVAKTPYFIDGEVYKIYAVKSPLRSVVESFSEELSATIKNDKGNTIILSVTDRSIQRAEDILNTVIDVYNDNWIKNKNQISVSTSEFINERLGVIEGELGHVDQDISSYKSEHQIPDVAQAASMYMNESQQASSQLLSLNNQLQMARYVREFITNTSNRNQVLPANSGIGSNAVESQIAEYNTMMLQRNQFASNSSENNPVVEGLDSKLAGKRSAIIQSIDNEIVSLNTAIKNIQNSKNRATAQIVANPTQAKYLLSVERQQKVKESLYLFLLQKREENELSQAFTAYNTEIITYPTGSNNPIAPNRKKILLCALLIGLALPFAYSYVRESCNTKIRGRKDIQDLSLPFIGEIPNAIVKKSDKNMSLPLRGKKSNADRQRTLVVKEGKRDVINEAFRVLRTNLEFMNEHVDGANVIAFTSFNPGSGKSFISMNVAYTLAIKSKRVLVIDGDMRHGSASAYISSPDYGLADLLGGRIADVSVAIKPFPGCANLNILPVGTIPPNPTELLENGGLGRIIDSLRGEYDYIIIDCPPIEVVADTKIIDKFVDRTVFIIRAGLFERSMLPDLEKIFTEKKYKNISLILNGTDAAQGYSHSYRYGYGYGYGYGY